MLALHSLLFLLPDLFRKVRTWRKTMQTQKPGNFSVPEPEIVETESRQRASGANTS